MLKSSQSRSAKFIDRGDTVSTIYPRTRLKRLDAISQCAFDHRRFHSADPAHARESGRWAAWLSVVAAMCWGAIPPQAQAAQVQAYAIFEIAASTEVNAAAEKLRSTSLGNCRQLIVGTQGQDVFVHIACDDRGDYLNQAFL